MRAALFLAAAAQSWLGVGGFLTSTRLSTSSTRPLLPELRRAVTDYPDGSNVREDEGGQDVQDRLREAIWKATDAVVRAVDDLPPLKHEEALQKLGRYIEDIDDKYFAKYRSVGTTNSYLDSLSPKVREVVEEAGTVATKKAREKDTEEAKGSMPPEASAGSPVVAPTAPEETEKATAETAPEDSSPPSLSKPDPEPVSSSDEDKDGSGTVQLDRPKQVQGVFDELQKKAVEYYKQAPVIAGFGRKEEPTDPKADAAAEAKARAEKAKETEAKLEDLMKESGFKPRALKKDKRGAFIHALSSLEENYPKDAAPLADSALRGEWTLVYCSKKDLVRKILRGLLSKIVAVASPTQTIDTMASSVINSCRVRLRLTRLRWGTLSQKGTFRVSDAGGDAALRKVEVTFPRVERPMWRRFFLPRLNTEAMAGGVETEITYLSDRWRICRANGVTLAFRKSS